MKTAETSVMGGIFSLLNGTIRVELAVRREGTDNDVTISLEVEFDFQKSDPAPASNRM